MLHFAPNHLTNKSGAAMIEMAIVVPFFIFIIVAIVDFGLYFNKRNVAQSAAWNGAKECSGWAKATNPPLWASFDGTQLTATSVMAQTLPPLISYSTSESNGLTAIPVCTHKISGGANYMEVTVSVKGTMTSIFTSTLGLYPIKAIGIAN